MTDLHLADAFFPYAIPARRELCQEPDYLGATQQRIRRLPS